MLNKKKKTDMKVYILRGSDHDYDQGQDTILAVYSDETEAQGVLEQLNAIASCSRERSKTFASKLNAVLPGAGDFSWLHALEFDIEEHEVIF